MNIENIIINKLKESELFQSFSLSDAKDITGLKCGSEALFFATLLKEKNKPILILKENEEEAFSLAQNIAFYNVECYNFPDYDTIPFTEMSPITDIMHERINILYKSTFKESIIIVASIKSILRLLPHKDIFNEYILELTIGMKIDLEYLRLFLSDIGYVNSREVLEKGVMTTRGSIFDIFSPIYENPIRIEFFDDEIESIRYFSIENGKSFQSVESAVIVPIRECVFDDECLQDILESEDNNIDGVVKEKLIHSKYFAGSENLLPIFTEKTQTIFDYYDSSMIFVSDKTQIKSIFSEYIKAIDYSFESEDNIFKCIENYNRLYIKEDCFYNILNSSINVTHFETPDTKIVFDFKEGVSFKSRLTEFLEYIKEHLSLEYFIILTTSHDEQARRFYKLTEDFNPILILENEDKNRVEDSSNFIITNSKSNLGFTSKSIKTLFITDNEVFGRKRKKHLRIPKANKSLIETFVDLNVGDYAVHVNYGIGLYLGLTRKSSGGKEKDYITLEYAKGDKLYIPVEQMNFVQKYISGSGGGPVLTHLGGSSWDKIKTKAKSDAEAMAKELVKLYAIRSKIRGNVYEKDTQWQDDFEASFMYEETPDQLRAVSEIKSDMESEKMMDRLVCGDVGFGKTEVAFRAIFKAIMSGKQVAILCPTTILSQQHFENAKKRFKDFPIKIGLLNRFLSTKEVRETKNRVKEGSIDLIIGTHKLLAKDVEFKNLMLIVVDEEQRFGVKHKEALKNLKLGSDVLTLSATPIPRTLNMALSGIRDISIIETPPLNRVPVKTFVTEFNEHTVETAILRELERNGQVFFLYNRIDTIDSFAVMIKGICKKARIGIAHGRLTGHQLEKIMKDFIDHKYDILISTTIIENGIDIPNANTILIDNAHKLGLSELYQLRGRVGRSDKEAYAYLFYPSDLSLSEIAYKRLEAISEHTDLGSGFKIAMKDLEIRGAGSILGKEQSGTIYQVGYELYTQMLEEAANQYKGEIKEVTFDTVIDFKHNLFIPDTYISDPKEKISAYKTIMRSQAMEDIADTSEYIEDKYGKMPNEVTEIFEIAKLKSFLKSIKVLSVIEGNYNIYIKLDEYSKIDGRSIAKLVSTKGSGLYLDNTNFNQLIVPIVEDSLEWKIGKVREILAQIEEHEVKKEGDSTDYNDKKLSMVDVNLKEINKNSKKRSPKVRFIRKRRD